MREGEYLGAQNGWWGKGCRGRRRLPVEQGVQRRTPPKDPMTKADA